MAYNAAEWLDHCPLQSDGLELCAQYKKGRNDLCSGQTAFIRYMDRFPEGILSVDGYDAAEDLFQAVFPDWCRTGG
jgi:hypothetical protein